MTNILLIFNQPNIANNANNLLFYYEALANELRNNGCCVKLLCFISSFCNPNIPQDKKEEIIDETKSFRPDLIITFNNMIIEDIIENTDCPIVLFNADSSDCFTNLNLIKKFNDRYIMGTFYPEWEDYQKFGFNEDKICVLHPATSIKKEKLNKDKNISFIGANFNYGDNIYTEFLKKDDSGNLYKMLRNFWENHNYNYKELISKYFNEHTIKHNNLKNTFNIFGMFDSRYYILTSLLDLGLNLYGKGWEVAPKHNPALASAFIKDPVYSLKQNQDIYNSSKINISISHPQTQGYAFPWRIYDIMASDGLLITSRSKLLDKMTDGYVEIPSYDSPYDARDLCKKYLKEDSYREDIIEAANLYIEKHGRWQSNFEILQDYTGVKLTNTPNKTSPEISVINILPANKYEKNKAMKLVVAAGLLIASNIPWLKEKFSKKDLKIIYSSLNKYKPEFIEGE